MTKCPQCNKKIDDSYGYALDLGDSVEHWCMNCEKAVIIKKTK